MYIYKIYYKVLDKISLRLLTANKEKQNVHNLEIEIFNKRNTFINVPKTVTVSKSKLPKKVFLVFIYIYFFLIFKDWFFRSKTVLIAILGKQC